MNMLELIEIINDIDCVLYSVVLIEGKITRTECFTTRDDVIAYLFDKDIGMWSLMGYNYDKIDRYLPCVTISLYRNLN